MDETFHNLFDIEFLESFVSTFRLKRQKLSQNGQI